MLRISKINSIISVGPPRGCQRLLSRPQRPFKIMRKVYHYVYQIIGFKC
jgi:hypothetical protein